MIDSYLLAIREAEAGGALVQYDFLSGFSGSKLLGALQRLTLAAPQDSVYCEIGVYQGLSLVSVAAANPGRACFGIDNFAYFDPQGTNRQTVDDRLKRAGATNVRLIDQDYEDALDAMPDYLQGRSIGVYFVDGPHDYRSQLMCLQLAVPYLHPEAVIIVDDSNYPHVRQANRDFLRTHPRFKLLFETYTDKHPSNMRTHELSQAREGWWNGANILVSDSKNTLPYLEPPTMRSRQLFENEHELHAMRNAHLAPLAMQAVSSLRPLKPKQLLGSAARLFKEVILDGSGLEDHDALNVYSESLPTRYNSPR